MPEFAHKRQLPSTVYANPPDDPHYSSGPVHTCLYVRARVTGDWDPFLGPLERARARAETGGADQWVLKRRECPGFARVNQVTSASLGYPLSVFNKNSTLKNQTTQKEDPPLGGGVPAINIHIHVNMFVYICPCVVFYISCTWSVPWWFPETGLASK